jgi:mono/diheme cytochrome c family protein
MRKLPVAAALIAALAAVSCGGPPRLPAAPRGEKVLELRGTIEGAPIALGAEDLAGLPRATVRGRDPVSGEEAAWEGLSLAALVERVRPKKRAVPDTMVVRTTDGAAVPVPLTLVRQLKPVLTDRTDGATVQRILAWPNLEHHGLSADPRAAGWWARGVVVLELVPWTRAYAPALAAPIGSSAAARVGAGLYASRCVACHTLRGAGGTVGPELTAVATRLDVARFTAAMETHEFARRGLAAPAPADREQLWAFLLAVTRAPPDPSPRDDRRDDDRDEDDAPPRPGRY